MENKATPIIAIIILVLVGIFFYALIFSDPEMNDDTLITQQNNIMPEETNAPSGWQMYEYPQFNFTFAYPPMATTSIESGKAVVMYLGQDNTPNSEISDGFTFTVETQSRGEGTSTLDIAREQLRLETGDGNATTAIESATIGDTDAHEFTTPSRLGPPITYVVIEADADTVFIVTYMVADPNDQNYEQMIRAMLESLRYTNV